MDTISIKAHAKINLTLNVCGVKDGYHILDSIVATVGLYDVITVKRAQGISITMRGEGCENIPYEGNNAVRAARLFFEKFPLGGADISIEKHIPVGAGLGGSSADAAGVLNALSSLYNVNDRAAIESLADCTGSDTRYMLRGGYARLFGRGEKVKPIDGDTRLNILLLVPCGGVSTAQCYRAFDALGAVGGDSDSAESAIVKGDILSLAGRLNNALEGAASSLSDGILRCRRELESLRPLAVNMTGSGSGVYALFEDEKGCRAAERSYRGSARVFNLTTII